MTSPVRRREALLAALTVGLSVAATLAVAELALRIAHGGLAERPVSAAGRRSLLGFAGGYPAEYDETLGYVPRPGASGRDNLWRREVTIDADGLRANGAPRPPGVPLLALGDSFTFGDEVDDADTWPARLERELGRPVLNGGVFGYGVDQIVLRGERLLDGAGADADAIAVSLLPEDVLRCEFSYRYSWKPYFALDGDRLVLHNVPVPRPHRGPPGESAPRRALRHSFVADLLFRAVDPDGWGVPESVRVHRDGPEVARRLFDRLVTRAHGEGRALLLVVQWIPRSDPEPIAPLVARARLRGVPVLDLRAALEPEVAQRGTDALFVMHEARAGLEVPSHLNAEGNRVAAEAIAAALRALGR